jgi:hypothetical protein
MLQYYNIINVQYPSTKRPSTYYVQVLEDRQRTPSTYSEHTYIYTLIEHLTIVVDDSFTVTSGEPFLTWLHWRPRRHAPSGRTCLSRQRQEAAQDAC